jgi:hypothetical protein
MRTSTTSPEIAVSAATVQMAAVIPSRSAIRPAEDVRGEERQDSPLLADHPADERVDGDQEGELGRRSAGARA